MKNEVGTNRYSIVCKSHAYSGQRMDIEDIRDRLRLVCHLKVEGGGVHK